MKPNKINIGDCFIVSDWEGAYSAIMMAAEITGTTIVFHRITRFGIGYIMQPKRFRSLRYDTAIEWKCDGRKETLTPTSRDVWARLYETAKSRATAIAKIPDCSDELYFTKILKMNSMFEALFYSTIKRQ